MKKLFLNSALILLALTVSFCSKKTDHEPKNEKETEKAVRDTPIEEKETKEEEKEIKIFLSKFAETNLKTKTDFVELKDQYKTDASAYLTYEETLAACPKGWKIPSKEDYEAVLGTEDLDVEEAAVTRIVKEEKGNVAYKIEFKDLSEKEKALRVTGRFIGTKETEDWSMENKDGDVIRVFPFAGLKQGREGSGGYYWTSTKVEGEAKVNYLSTMIRNTSFKNASLTFTFPARYIKE